MYYAQYLEFLRFFENTILEGHEKKPRHHDYRRRLNPLMRITKLVDKREQDKKINQIPKYVDHKISNASSKQGPFVSKCPSPISKKSNGCAHDIQQSHRFFGFDTPIGDE